MSQSLLFGKYGKRRNIIIHEGRMSKNAMISLVSIATSKIITWECPSKGKLKCNSDGAFKHMLSVSYIAFSIRNHYRDFIFTKTRKVELSFALEAEVSFGSRNKLVVFLANNIANFTSTNRIFNSLQELPQ
ncbi:hypothetical protein R3W88_033136 [Solanum pinnatisectum]|uniref:Uncharacterized protein n=1 Tax=Solanum pinnatisectum TaxID=50273 RepID=A0AAV9K2A0_9SOLN|nr:hypothetical protein R3W88_033136 [Solanum pinnatisectum]